MSDYRSLELKDDPKETAVDNWDDLPEQRSSFAPPLQPGRYEFRLPPRAAIERAWDTMETKIRQEDSVKVQRVFLQFGADCPLEVIAGLRHVGDMWQGRIANNERNRAKRGDAPKFASDMDYLLRDALRHNGKPQGNRGYIEALNSHGGETFVADNEWSAYCNPGKKRYIDNGSGGSDEDPTGTAGCGKKYYTKDFSRDEAGQYNSEIYCACGAKLRAFQNLDRFAPGQAEAGVA